MGEDKASRQQTKRLNEYQGAILAYAGDGRKCVYRALDGLFYPDGTNVLPPLDIASPCVFRVVYAIRCLSVADRARAEVTIDATEPQPPVSSVAWSNSVGQADHIPWAIGLRIAGNRDTLRFPTVPDALRLWDELDRVESILISRARHSSFDRMVEYAFGKGVTIVEPSIRRMWERGSSPNRIIRQLKRLQLLPQS